MPRKIVVAANSAGNVVTFRQGLIRALKANGDRPIIVAPVDPPAEHRIQRLEVQRITVDVDRSGLNPLTDLRLLLAYRKILKQLSPAAFLSFTIKPNIYGCIAARLLGIPAIPNISGLGTVFLMGGPLSLLVTGMYRLALARCPVVFFQNRDDLELFVGQRMVLRAQARLVPGSGIDLDHFAPAQLPAGTPRFLLIARLLRDKGVREYVEAARMLRREGLDARFQLLGPIDTGNRSAIQRDELDRWVRESAIEYLGSAEDVRPHVAEASVVVLPSYREGLPRSLLEGAAMGRPLVTTDVPGCREVVDPGVNGLLCEVRSAVSLADALRVLIAMPAEQRSKMGLASRGLVEERFSEKRVIAAYLDALNSFALPG